MNLTLTHQRLPGVTVIRVAGELDMMTHGLLDQHLERLWRPHDQLIIDLTKTTFIDCSGIRTLMHARDRARQGGGVLRLAAPQPLPAKVIRLADPETVLTVHLSLEHAISAAFNGPSSPAPQAHTS